MIPGPYAICHIDFPENSDAAIFKTLRFGYDSAEAAYRELEKVATEKKLDVSECGVIREIDREEAADFKS